MHHFIPHATAARRRKSNRPNSGFYVHGTTHFRNQPLADGKPQTDTFHIIVHLDEACEKALQFIFCNAGSPYPSHKIPDIYPAGRYIPA